VITAIIPTFQSERLLVPTLSGLVPGAADGILRQVVIADSGSTDDTLRLADQAGCDAVSASTPVGAFAEAVAMARATWLMLLPPGPVLEEGWVREVSTFVEQTERRGLAGERAAVFRYGTDTFRDRRPLIELVAILREQLRSLPRSEQGLLMSMRLYRELGGHRATASDPARDLLRRLGRRRIVTLRTLNVATDS
jgi:glycosyltransferase involved in cell wall biosynthesis